MIITALTFLFNIFYVLCLFGIVALNACVVNSDIKISFIPLNRDDEGPRWHPSIDILTLIILCIYETYLLNGLTTNCNTSYALTRYELQRRVVDNLPGIFIIKVLCSIVAIYLCILDSWLLTSIIVFIFQFMVPYLLYFLIGLIG